MAWKCHDQNCDYCEHPLPDTMICDMIYGGHYDSAYCWRMGRQRIQQYVNQVVVIKVEP